MYSLEDNVPLGCFLLFLGLIFLSGSSRFDDRFIRPVLCAISALLLIRYLAWRWLETLPEPEFTAYFVIALLFFIMESMAAISALGVFLMLSRTLNRSEEADKNARWWGCRKPPRIDVYITTYNEGRDVLERTIAGASILQYPNYRVFVLDDGNCAWLADFCARSNVGYITRPDNQHAKSGNINHAFTLRRAQPDRPEFIAILDADFVPHRNFLARTIALCHDDTVGIVQTPQFFFNPDPIQHNLGGFELYPDDQRFFFDCIGPSRDAWGIAACCGTSSLIRAGHLGKDRRLSNRKRDRRFSMHISHGRSRLQNRLSL